jgi:hypothetical protein
LAAGNKPSISSQIDVQEVHEPTRIRGGIAVLTDIGSKALDP